MEHIFTTSFRYDKAILLTLRRIGSMEIRRIVARVFTVLIPTHVSEAAKNCPIVTRMNMKTSHGTEGVKRKLSRYLFRSFA